MVRKRRQLFHNVAKTTLTSVVEIKVSLCHRSIASSIASSIAPSILAGARTLCSSSTRTAPCPSVAPTVAPTLGDAQAAPTLGDAQAAPLPVFGLGASMIPETPLFVVIVAIHM